MRQGPGPWALGLFIIKKKVLKMHIMLVFFLISSLLISVLSLRSPLHKKISNSHYNLKKNGVYSRRETKLEANGISTTSAVTRIIASGSPDKSIVARILGYSMGAGAMALYIPIILKLMKEKENVAEGMSIQTWVMNVIGFTAATLYPMKCGFAFASYVDMFLLTIQAIIVMGITCFYRGYKQSFTIGLGVYLLSTISLIAAPLPSSLFSSLQIFAIIICNYANFPQILMAARSGIASWSSLTAAMSTGGNLIKMFTTVKLTGDKLIFIGHGLGALTNGILLTQCLLLGSKKKE